MEGIRNGIIDNGIDIESRADGVYILINCKKAGRKPTRKEILDIVEQYAVQDINFVALNGVFQAESEYSETKISSNPTILIKDETMTVEIAKNKLEARVKFSEPINKGKRLSKEDIIRQLNDAGIVYGINDGLIQELAQDKVYDYFYLIASGLSPVDGVDGYLDYNFDPGAASLKPKILSDGSVDFHQLSLVKQCSAGAVLIMSVPTVDGAEGMDLTGKVISYKKGKMPPPLPRGKNVYVSEDGRKLIAEIDGQILYANNKLNVSPLLEIPENVDNSTGDIDFRGTVVVKGNVLTGFSIKALGNIEVMGVVEGATLYSEAHILLCNGVQGSDKASITAVGDITAKYLENCADVVAGGSITTDSVLHSNIKCGDSLIVTGRKGMVVGGQIIVRNRIVAQEIGSSMATSMDIEVGHLPERVEEYRALTAEYMSVNKEYDKVTKVVETLNALSEKAALTEEKRAVLIKAVHSVSHYKNRLTHLQVRIKELKAILSTRNGSVKANKVIHHGVKIMIGDAMLFVRDDLMACVLTNEEGRIAVRY